MHFQPSLPPELWDTLSPVVQAALRQLVERHARELTDLRTELTGRRARLPEDTPGPALIPSTAADDDGPDRPRVSLCLIVKNEEANLANCLASAADLCDEVIVVDTGSTDRTRAIAADFGARVFDFAWGDDFAAARNESLSQARGEWIFWLDADESLDADNRARLQALFAQLGDENVGYLMSPPSVLGGGAGSTRGTDQVRLFRNHPANRWQGRVHEQILPAIQRLGGQARRTDIAIRHTGYQDPAVRHRKHERNLAALLLDHAEHPENAFILFNVGWTYVGLGKPDDALPFLRRSLERARPDEAFLRKLYALLARLHRQRGEREQALALCRGGLARFPNDTELGFQEGMLLFERGELGPAETALVRVLEAPAADVMAIGEDPSQRGYQTRYNLGVIYRDQGKAAAAEAQWRQVLQERPEFFPARVGLAELWLTQQRWAEVAQMAADRETQPQGAMDALLLRAKLAAAQGDFAAARQLAEQAIQQAPGAVWPRLILSHVHLQEGRDAAATEQALRDVLALEPGHLQTRGNLEAFLRKQRRGPDTADLSDIRPPKI
jgi:glycosyltransferase involved in cell wall biosynthesis